MTPVGAPELREDELTVRLARVGDARELFRLLLENREWLAQWEATYPSQRASVPPTLADVRASLKSMLRSARNGSAVPFVLERHGRVLGQLNVSAIMRGSVSSAVIGYWLSKEAAGSGLMTRAVALVTDWCFETLGLHRIEICVRPENRASQRVVEKLGFRFEGLRRRFIHINGQWADHYCYALVREEVPCGVLHRYRSKQVPEDAAVIPERVRAEAARPLV